MAGRVLWLPQRGVRSGLYQPDVHEQVEGDVWIMGFAFLNEAALATDSQSVSPDGDFLVDGVTVYGDAFKPNFQLQLYHQRAAVQRQLFFNQTLANLIAGSGGNKFLLTSPYLVGKGDTVTADIANLGQNNAGTFVAQSIHIALHGILLR